MDKWYKLYNINHPFTDEMIAELRNGCKIQAIKLHRAKYLTGLHEAKDEVEYFVKHNNIQVTQEIKEPMEYQPVTEAMKCLIKNGFIDDAISLYMLTYNVGYGCAHDSLEEFMCAPQTMVVALHNLTVFYDSFAHQVDGLVAKKAKYALNFIADFIAKE